MRGGVLQPRCPGAVVAVLAAQMAGGAYVPLDPVLPGDRLGFLMVDCGISVVVTEAGLADRLAAHRAHRVALVTIDPATGALPAAEAGTPAAIGAGGRPVSAVARMALNPENLAYVL